MPLGKVSAFIEPLQVRKDLLRRMRSSFGVPAFGIEMKGYAVQLPLLGSMR